jgi:hypothetical protein
MLVILIAGQIAKSDDNESELTSGNLTGSFGAVRFLNNTNKMSHTEENNKQCQLKRSGCHYTINKCQNIICVITINPKAGIFCHKMGIRQGHVKLYGLHDNAQTGTRSPRNKSMHVSCHQSEDVTA